MATIRLSSAIFKILLLSLSVLANISVESSLSDNISESHSLAGRNLLQVPKACPVNFEMQNYTILTSQCKGPSYRAGPCCKAFKEFACPFAEYLNDLSNVCSETMFSYIEINGKYPAGLFASRCIEGKDGLSCSAFVAPPPQPADSNSGIRTTHNRYQILMFTTSCLVQLLSML